MDKTLNVRIGPNGPIVEVIELPEPAKTAPEQRALALLRELVAELGRPSPNTLWGRGRWYSTIETRAVSIIDDEWVERAINLLEEIGD
jgi:hypothetical protein